jgi:hypothetical protein
MDGLVFCSRNDNDVMTQPKDKIDLDRGFEQWLEKHRSWLSEKYQHLIGRTIKRRYSENVDDANHFKIKEITFSHSFGFKVHIPTTSFPVITFNIRSYSAFLHNVPLFHINENENGTLGDFVVNCSAFFYSVNVDMLDQIFTNHQISIPKPILAIINQFQAEWLVSDEWTRLTSWFSCSYETPTPQTDASLSSVLLSECILE